LKHFPPFLEQILPFAAYVYAKRKIDSELDDVLNNLKTSEPIEAAFNKYSNLGREELEALLKAEHARAEALTEKTFKFGASFATGLTVVSIAIVFAGSKLAGAGWKVAVLASMCPAFVFIAAGGMLGLSAIRVQRWFGSGASAAVERKGKTDTELVTLAARDLALQERANIINTMRNEAAFMSLRNGLLLLIIALSVALFGLSGLQLDVGFDFLSNDFGSDSA